MLDLSHLATNPKVDIQQFPGNSVAVGVTWQVWNKPRGVNMVYIILLGSGGGGGTGAVGVTGAAAGGGGGGSAGQSTILIPAFLLPDQLFISTGIGAAAAGFASYVSISQNTTQNHLVLHAAGGGLGGNASAGTAGTNGTAGAVSTIGTAPLGGLGVPFYLAGQVGTSGGNSIPGPSVTLPVTGLICTGGAGGAGIPAAPTAGNAGGGLSVPVAPSPFPPQIGGAGGAAVTTPPERGSNGWSGMNKLFYNYGGAGGGSTHGSASGAGLVQAAGGDGAYGCGAGGMGGALTGSTAAVQAKGGSGIAIIISW